MEPSARFSSQLSYPHSGSKEIFPQGRHPEKTETLNGGEKSRLNLFKFLVDPPNLLLMDDPTMHPDIHSVESLVLALGSYEGTLVFISHGVHFIRKLTTKVLHVSGGKVTPYPGGYDYFLEKTGALQDERWALTAK